MYPTDHRYPDLSRTMQSFGSQGNLHILFSLSVETKSVEITPLASLHDYAVKDSERSEVDVASFEHLGDLRMHLLYLLLVGLTDVSQYPDHHRRHPLEIDRNGDWSMPSHTCGLASSELSKCLV